ncbi:LytR/AlgR family response regulator transcription factor [Tenacibaculum amylolyticum]|uniref:LytR/AlgR family response regulator transcription factor n=1 Tax=Tenacibaculum amylolyticum TaxID=104269 RepID=UPI0038940A15
MRALIIEDELPSLRRLERLLFAHNIEIIASIRSIKKAVTWLSNNKHPDIIFLDVQLSDGICFEIFKEVEVNSKIIFTTAYSQYSIKAFEYNSIFYLLKPINELDLSNAIKKASVIQKVEDDYRTLQTLFLESEYRNYKKSFTIKIGGKIKIIKDTEVLCFYSKDSTTYIQSINSKGIIPISLKNLGEELDPNLFFRVSRSHIISNCFIESINKHNKAQFLLRLKRPYNQEIIVSRDRVKDFKNWIE